MSFPEILVLSRSKAKQFECEVPWACISIADGDNDWPKLSKFQQVDLLQLHFLDKDVFEDGMEGELFSSRHAKKIFDFVEKNLGKIEVLMLHCYAGVSRSPAVAAALSKVYLNSDEAYFKKFVPNMLVYRTMLETRFLEQNP